MLQRVTIEYVDLETAKAATGTRIVVSRVDAALVGDQPARAATAAATRLPQAEAK
jgi:hypothetical protein